MNHPAIINEVELLQVFQKEAKACPVPMYYDEVSQGPARVRHGRPHAKLINVISLLIDGCLYNFSHFIISSDGEKGQSR